MNTQELQQLQTRLGHVFSRPELLEEALTHTTYCHEHPEAKSDNERLEYLGDSVLSLVVAHHLFCAFPAMDEGGLTKWRAALTNRQAIALMAISLNIRPHIRLGHGMHSAPEDSPSLLCDCMEAVIGAIYLDGGLDAARRFLEPMLAAQLENQEPALSSLMDNPKGLLQEFCQSRWGLLPEYRLVNESGPSHNPSFEYEVWVQGERMGCARAGKKQTAQSEAARAALLAVRDRFSS